MTNNHLGSGHCKSYNKYNLFILDFFIRQKIYKSMINDQISFRSKKLK